MIFVYQSRWAHEPKPVGNSFPSFQKAMLVYCAAHKYALFEIPGEVHPISFNLKFIHLVIGNSDDIHFTVLVGQAFNNKIVALLPQLALQQNRYKLAKIRAQQLTYPFI